MIRLGISGGYVTKLLSKPHPYFAGINCNCTDNHYLPHSAIYVKENTMALFLLSHKLPTFLATIIGWHH